MADGYTITGWGLGVVVALALFKVGSVVWSRRPAGPGSTAARAFAIWWFTLGALQFGGILDALVSTTLGWTLGTYLAYVQGVILALVVALAALMYYMIYLFTGWRGAWKVVGVAYGAYLMAILYWIALSSPEGLTEGAMGTEIAYANDLSETTFAQAIGILIVVPPILAAIAYLTLFFRVPERSQKFRIAAIGGTFAIWFGSSLVISQLTDWGETRIWPLASSVITLVAAGVVYVAFKPPRWMERRLDLHGYGDHNAH